MSCPPRHGSMLSRSAGWAGSRRRRWAVRRAAAVSSSQDGGGVRRGAGTSSLQGWRTYRRGDIFHNQNILYIDSLQVKLFSNRNQLHITIMNDYVMGNICFIHRLDNGHPPAIHQDKEFYLNLCHWKLPWLNTFVSYPAVLETLHLCGVWKKNETLFSVRTTRPLSWLWKVWTMALVKVSRESNDDWFWG